MMVCIHALLIQFRCSELIDISASLVSKSEKLLQGDSRRTNAIRILTYVVG